MSKEKIEVQGLIKLFADNLPEKELVRNDITYFPGAELKLTGIKNWKGKPLQDDLTYPIEVPVVKYFHHEKNMRLAWLKSGLQGIYTYLEPFIGPDHLKNLKHSFMQARKNNMINA